MGFMVQFYKVQSGKSKQILPQLFYICYFGKLQTLFELISSSPKLGNNPTRAAVLL